MEKTVVLVNPPLQLQDRYGKDMKHFGGVAEPLGLAYIAAYLETKGIPVRIIDAPAENLTMDEVVQDIGSNKDTIIGITMLTPMFRVVKQLCEQLKHHYPKCLIVLGGVHCTALPERTLQEISEADIICIGEGELTMADIVRREPIDWKDIPGICFRQHDLPIKTAPRQYVRDIDLLPPPARHLLPITKYRLTASRVDNSAYCPTIVVARGCPFSCSYCSHPLGKVFRHHSVERILKEIRQLLTQYNITQLNIEADTLTANKTFLKDLCAALIESGMSGKITWTCESRVDTVDREMLQLMKDASCWQISYGVESGSQRLLDSIDKSITLSKIQEVFQLTKSVGISIRGFFMLGLPTETHEESLVTIAFAKKLDPLWAQFTITIPYPGTPMFHDLERKGQLRSYDWSKYNTWSGWKGENELPYLSEGRSVQELFQLQKQALREFYLRPVVFWRFLRTTTSLYHLRKYFFGVWILLKSKVS